MSSSSTIFVLCSFALFQEKSQHQVDLRHTSTLTFGNIIRSSFNKREDEGSVIVIPESPNMFVPILNTSLNIIKWCFFANQFGMISMQIWRKVQSEAYTLLGQTVHYVMAIGTQIVYPDKIIHVIPGDVLGFYVPNDIVLSYQCRTSRECEGYFNHFFKWENEKDIETGVTYYRATQSHRGRYCQCKQYPLQATIQRKLR